jgi:protein TonB
MTATSILPVNRGSRYETARWVAAAALVLAAHAGLIAGYSLVRPLHPQGAEDAPAVIIDLAPLTVAPTIQRQDLAPGPELPPTEPEPVQPPTSEIAEPPKVEPPPKAEVVAPPRVEPPPAFAPLVTLPRPRPDVRPKEVETPHETAPPQPTAPPKAEETAPAPAAARAGSTNADVVSPSWVRRLLAHLNRYKQYPGAARRRREEGVVTLSFTVGRDGRVLARHVAKTSGSPALDSEALAMLERAEPLPEFPPTMSGPSRTFNVPIRFSLR